MQFLDFKREAKGLAAKLFNKVGNNMFGFLPVLLLVVEVYVG